MEHIVPDGISLLRVYYARLDNREPPTVLSISICNALTHLPTATDREMDTREYSTFMNPVPRAVTVRRAGAHVL